MNIVETTLLRAVLIFLVLGSVSGLIAGIMLILRPVWLERAGRFANRWISTRRFDRLLEASINVDPLFERHWRAAGAIMLAGAIYILYFFGMHIDEASAIASLERAFRMPAAYLDVLFDPLKTVALAGAAFAALASLLLLFFPGRFHKVEQGANEWLSLRKEMKPLEISRNGLDQFAFHHTRQIGMLLVIGSIYTLVMFSFWAR